MLRRSFHAGGQPAVSLVRAGLLIAWLRLNVSGFRPVLARAWHGRSECGVLHLVAVRVNWHEQEHCQGTVDTDPSLVSYRHPIGYCRSPGNLASLVTRSIGWSRMLLWSAMVVSIQAHGSGSCFFGEGEDSWFVKSQPRQIPASPLIGATYWAAALAFRGLSDQTTMANTPRTRMTVVTMRHASMRA